MNHPDYKKTANLLECDIKIHGELSVYPGDGTFGFSCNHREEGDLSPIDESLVIKYPMFYFQRVFHVIQEQRLIIGHMKRLKKN